MDTVTANKWNEDREIDGKIEPETLPSHPPSPFDVPERCTASPELPPKATGTRRPVMQRFYSTPDIRSPGRQKFRLQNGERRPVKETPSILEKETQLGRQINQYRIIKPIGNGRYGQVWLAQDNSEEEHASTSPVEQSLVAVKEFSKVDILKANRKRLMQLRRHKQSASASDLIAKEVAIMKKIDHPNLVELIEVLEDESSDKLFMIIEWCEHGQLPIDGNLDEKQCRLYFRDMILAVEYLHSMGITHRDIKAENVLLGEGDVLKLADFGVSEIFESPDEDTLKSCVGSPAYYAPELANLAHGGYGSQELNVVSGRKTDIWAMGVTLYYMFHGHLPFQTETLADLYHEICNCDPSFRLAISPEFRDLLGRILTKDFSKRITMAELREHPWVTSNGTDPLLSREENTGEQTAITEEDLSNAIDRAEFLFNQPVDPAEVSSQLQKDHGWRGASGTATPQTPAGQANASLNVDKLVRALEEIIRLKNWDDN